MDEAELRRRRREVAKRLHPDVGGDPEAFLAAMRALEQPARPAQRNPGGTGTPVTVTTSRGRRGVRVVTRTATGLVRTVRRRLPRSVPGSRRWGQP